MNCDYRCYHASQTLMTWLHFSNCKESNENKCSTIIDKKSFPFQAIKSNHWSFSSLLYNNVIPNTLAFFFLYRKVHHTFFWMANLIQTRTYLITFTVNFNCAKKHCIFLSKNIGNELMSMHSSNNTWKKGLRRDGWVKSTDVF